MTVTTQSNIDQFNATLSRYAAVYDPHGYFVADILLKKGASLGFEWASRLLGNRPAKGAITAERIAAMKAGEGLKIRPGLRERIAAKLGLRGDVFGKNGVRSRISKGRRLNFAALVNKAELGLRERGRGYTSFAARQRGLSQFSRLRDVKITSGKWRELGRYNQLLSEAGLDFSGLTLVYGGPKTDAGKALTTPDAQSRLSGALQAVTADMEVYMLRKADEQARKAGFAA